MIVNCNYENCVTYDERDEIAHFLTLNWLVVKSRFDVPNGYTRVARAGRYDFYANIYDTHERPRYCVINPQTNKEV